MTHTLLGAVAILAAALIFLAVVALGESDALDYGDIS